MERAQGIRTLMNQANLTAEQAAKQLGLSRATVSRSLALLSLPEEIQAMVASEAISADAAYQLSQIEDPARQRILAAQMAAGELNRDGLVRKLKRIKRGEESKATVSHCAKVKALWVMGGPSRSPVRRSRWRVQSAGSKSCLGAPAKPRPVACPLRPSCGI